VRIALPIGSDNRTNWTPLRFIAQFVRALPNPGAPFFALTLLLGCAIPVEVPSPAEAALIADGIKVIVQSLRCLSTGEVVAAGIEDAIADGRGVVFLSEDRGATWRRVPLRAPGTSLSLLVLPGDPEGVLYASGYRTGADLLSGMTTLRYEPGPWWITRDKGRSWQPSEPRLPLLPTTDITARLPAILRADQAGTLIGVVAEQRHLVVLRSSDHGKTWSRQALAKLGHYGSLVADGRGQVVLTGRADVIQSATPAARRIAVYRSSDAGATWQEVGLSPGIDLIGALRVYLTPGGTILAYGSDELPRSGYPAVISQSVDAGRTWGAARIFPNIGRIVSIAGDARGRVVALTSRGAILRSTDDGGSWRLAHSAGSSTDSSAMVLSNDGAILATRDGGRFMRSSDGGETWHAVDSDLPDRQFVLDAYCTDGRGLIVVGGSDGMVTRSTDWGATWQRGRLQAESH
jgi:photosystem II stability/assembly factor-like uncharacterized protein